MLHDVPANWDCWRLFWQATATGYVKQVTLMKTVTYNFVTIVTGVIVRGVRCSVAYPLPAR